MTNALRGPDIAASSQTNLLIVLSKRPHMFVLLFNYFAIYWDDTFILSSIPRAFPKVQECPQACPRWHAHLLTSELTLSELE
jgi:hypothetical protein